MLLYQPTPNHITQGFLAKVLKAKIGEVWGDWGVGGLGGGVGGLSPLSLSLFPS